ncbi:MAG: 4-(cytidine 5'-diphospho)-2-C-methyl-D-erythritol kinase, partial [Blastocatellia bacterium]
MTVSSRAKINWTLEVLGKRPDGYHELRTLLQTVDLADTLTLTPVDSGISIGCDHPEVPLDERNLVHRAARLLLEHTGIERGVRIEITKRIPTAAGLGGGSSNAAVTLLALCQLWDLDLKLSELVTLGSRIGADVPFFFFGGTCLGVGRGDEVYPVGEITADFMLLVNGGILVPSGDVYANLPPHLTSSSGWASRPMPVTHRVVCETSRRDAT